MFIPHERSEGFANGIFHPCALWARGLARLEELFARRRRRRRDVEFQVDIRARTLFLEFSDWTLTHMRALRILRPGFYT